MTTHWLTDQVAVLKALSQRCHLINERWTKREGGSETQESEARAAFMAALRKVVGQIKQHEGILACFVAHEGLVVEAIGEETEFEALAAMTQWCVTPAHHAVETLSLGTLQQILLIGSERKLALIQLGQMTLGILAPNSVQLSDTLKALA
jgi:predicted regulator of Ras-like GTPase activity (Roadblock/LC7/MglB family)